MLEPSLDEVILSEPYKAWDGEGLSAYDVRHLYLRHFL